MNLNINNSDDLFLDLFCFWSVVLFVYEDVNFHHTVLILRKLICGFTKFRDEMSGERIKPIIHSWTIIWNYEKKKSNKLSFSVVYHVRVFKRKGDRMTNVSAYYATRDYTMPAIDRRISDLLKRRIGAQDGPPAESIKERLVRHSMIPHNFHIGLHTADSQLIVFSIERIKIPRQDKIFFSYSLLSIFKKVFSPLNQRIVNLLKNFQNRHSEFSVCGVKIIQNW